MKTYKVKAKMILNVAYDVEAKSKEEAIHKFIESDWQNIFEYGDVLDVETKDEKADLVEADYKVLVSDISYDIGIYDVYTADLDEDAPDFYDIVNERIKELKAKLPTELTLELKYCKADEVEDTAIDQVSDETGFLVDFAKVAILEIN